MNFDSVSYFGKPYLSPPLPWFSASVNRGEGVCQHP